jgi:hypothetical protein
MKKLLLFAVQRCFAVVGPILASRDWIERKLPVGSIRLETRGTDLVSFRRLPLTHTLPTRNEEAGGGERSKTLDLATHH